MCMMYGSLDCKMIEYPLETAVIPHSTPHFNPPLSVPAIFAQARPAVNSLPRAPCGTAAALAHAKKNPAYYTRVLHHVVWIRYKNDVESLMGYIQWSIDVRIKR